MVNMNTNILEDREELLAKQHGLEIEIAFWKEKNKALQDELEQMQTQAKEKERAEPEAQPDSIDQKELATKITLLETQVCCSSYTD